MTMGCFVHNDGANDGGNMKHASDFIRVITLSAIFITAHAPSVPRAEVIHVPDDYATIREAIAAASQGDEIVVAEGTYVEYEIDFLGKAITVRSTDPEDPAVVSSTVVDGNGAGSVFLFQSDEGPASMLAGFSITGGKGSGGGILCSLSSPSVTGCVITGNRAEGSFWACGG